MVDFCFTVGNIQTRLARTKEEVLSALRLRYLELILVYNSNNTNPTGLDYDPIDDVCDHLIAIDTDVNEIIGTYRLIRKEHVDAFITESEYDLSKLKSHNLLEISRAVVKPQYRDGSAIQLLWKSIITYAKAYKSDYMIGTASFYGQDPMEYAASFTYLHHHHLSEEPIRCKALAPSYPLELIPEHEFDMMQAKRNLPPLIKGYLRLGCSIGDGIFMDASFNSLDVLIVLEIKTINPRYLKRFLGVDCEE